MRAIKFSSAIKRHAYDLDIWRDIIIDHLNSHGISVATFSANLDYLLSYLHEVTIWLESEEDYNMYSLLYSDDKILAKVVEKLYSKRINSTLF